MRGRGGLRARRQRGQELVELALVAAILLLLLLGSYDLLRVVMISDTVADAARQGARQAVPDALSSDQPFGSVNSSPCSGTTAAPNASGTGCLTDARIKSTVDAVLGTTVGGSTLTTAQPSACPTPAANQASVCIWPSQATRSSEWSTNAQDGSFTIDVTVVVRYSPVVPFSAVVFPSVFVMAATTAMVAEY